MQKSAKMLCRFLPVLINQKLDEKTNICDFSHIDSFDFYLLCADSSNDCRLWLFFQPTRLDWKATSSCFQFKPNPKLHTCGFSVLFIFRVSSVFTAWNSQKSLECICVFYVCLGASHYKHRLPRSLQSPNVMPAALLILFFSLGQLIHYLFFHLFLQITTDLRHRCTDSHTGTSASAPMAAAIIALALEAK